MWPFTPPPPIIEIFDFDGNKIEYEEYIEAEEMYIVLHEDGSREKLPTTNLTIKKT